MGIISLNKASRLYWLGRYTERVYTGLKKAKPIYDAAVDGHEGNYADYCRCLGIPGSYTDTADFCKRYFFDRTNPNSLASSLIYAYDNAVVLRDTLTTDTLSYIQLAVNAMEKAAQGDSPAVALQWVLDDILSFRGACEETIFEEETRSMRTMSRSCKAMLSVSIRQRSMVCTGTALAAGWCAAAAGSRIRRLAMIPTASCR